MMAVIDSIKGEIVNWFSPLPIVAGIGGYVPNDFMCPISGCVLEDAVTFGGHRHFYERYYIEEWLARDPTKSSPLTRQSCGKDGSPFRIEPANTEFVRQLEIYKKKLSKTSLSGGGAAAE